MKTKTWLVSRMILLVGMLLRSSAAFAADTPDNQRSIERCLTNWQAQFGPVDFTAKDRWNWMISVHPQPQTSFTVFSDEILSPGITGHHQTWIRNIFKGALLSALTNLGPTKFYMNEGRTESSLVYYELELQGNTISIQESYEAFLMTVKPRRFDTAEGIAPAFIGSILFEWVDLNKRRPSSTEIIRVPGSSSVLFGDTDEGDPFTIPYASPAELLDSFRLPPQLNVGDTFSNWTNPPPNITRYLKYWPAYVVGFVGSNGVSVIFFKVYDGGPRMGRLHDFNWLNKGLFQADGKTLVDPPKNRTSNESPEFREHLQPN